MSEGEPRAFYQWFHAIRNYLIIEIIWVEAVVEIDIGWDRICKVTCNVIFGAFDNNG